MKTYKVKTTFTFSGEFYVKAVNKEEANQLVNDECGMTFGSITSIADDEKIDWDFNMIPKKKVLTITLKPKKKK